MGASFGVDFKWPGDLSPGLFECADMDSIERESFDLNREAVLTSILEKDLGLRVNVGSLNEYVATADLYDAVGGIVTAGAGKGKASTIGALAEALEHYAFLTKEPGVLTLSRQQLLNQGAAQSDGYIQWLGMSDDELLLDCVGFSAVHALSNTLYVPAVLVDFSKVRQSACQCDEESYLIKYFTNSGVALGMGEKESLLHGVNEVVERDYLSQVYFFLISGVLPPLYRISVRWIECFFSTMPSVLGLAERMQVYFGNWKGIPFALCVISSNDNDPVALVGSGCSIYPQVAVRRAVSEAYQIATLQDDDTRRIDHNIKEFLVRLNFQSLIGLEDLCFVRELDFKDFLSCGRLSVSAQLDHVVRMLKVRGLDVFYREIARYGNDVRVTQVYVPGLDRFNLVRTGIRVLPQEELIKRAALDRLGSPVPHA